MRTRRTSITAIALLPCVLVAGALLAGPAAPASAHGYVGGPSSALIARGAWSANPDRGAIEWEPQSLEAPKGFPEHGPADGLLASAGGLFGGDLDEQSESRWAKNVVAPGPVTVGWTLTANHRTEGWRYFITTPGWDPNAPLDRGDFVLLASVPADGTAPPKTVTHTLTIPAGYSGYHVIYAVWDIADTSNAFYNTIDIDVRRPGSGASAASPASTATPTPTPTPTPSPTHSHGTTAAPSPTPSATRTPAATPTPSPTHSHGTTPAPVPMPSPSPAHSHAPAPSPTPSATAPVSPAVAAPTGLHTMSRTDTSIELMWRSGEGALRYGIERQEADGSFTRVGETVRDRFTVTGLSPSTTYRFRVVSVGVDRSGAKPVTVRTPSTVLTATTRAAAVPTTVTAPRDAPEWDPRGRYAAGDVVSWEGARYRASQSHRGYGDLSWITALALWQPLSSAR